MEEPAHMTFKVPPPGIEFTLPSPKIGIESLPVVDPPWMPEVKTKVEEVTINQERHVSSQRRPTLVNIRNGILLYFFIINKIEEEIICTKYTYSYIRMFNFD